MAKIIGVAPQAGTDWFPGRQQPTSEQILSVQEFLNEQRERQSGWIPFGMGLDVPNFPAFVEEF
jgi:hypothetical protein